MKLKNSAANRGARGTATGMSCFANTKHLFRIITYLGEQTEPVCKTWIGTFCCMGLQHTNDGLRFLTNAKIILRLNIGGCTLYQLNKRTAQEIIDEL